MSKQQLRTVMVAPTPAVADLVAATLAEHGIEASASTTAYAGAYPSVEWASGYRVEVPADQIDRAREILDTLSEPEDVTLTDGPNVEG